MRSKEKDTVNVVIGKNMAKMRAQFNLSQKEICQVIGVNRNTYKDYEVGKRTVPLQILQDLAKFYKVSTNYFFENMPQLPPDKELIMRRFAESVANNKEKYVAIDLFDPNAMKKIL